MFRIIFTFFLSSYIQSIQIGQIQNNIMIGKINNSFSNITLHQCLCQMITLNLSNLNYFQINQTCQLLNNNLNGTIYIQSYSNVSFMFINQSLITIISSQSVKETDTTTISNIHSTSVTKPITSHATTTENPYACGDMTILIGYDLPGDDITSSVLGNYSLCCEWCRSYIGCFAYTWGLSTAGWAASTCFLKYGTPASSANGALVSAHY